MKLTKLSSGLAFYGPPTKVMINIYTDQVFLDDSKKYVRLVPKAVETYTGPGIGPVKRSGRPAASGATCGAEQWSEEEVN
jgi:hypothetical protein